MADYPGVISVYSDDGYPSEGGHLSYLSRELSEFGDRHGDAESVSTRELEHGQGQEQGAEREEPEEPMEFDGYACTPALAALPEYEFRSDLTDTCVILILGREDTPAKLCVNKQLVCYHSPVLNYVLNHDVEYEGGVQIYRFEELNHKLAFSFLIQWFNSKKIGPLVAEEGFVIPASSFTRVERWLLMDKEDLALIQAWLLADRWEVPECRAYIGRRIRERHRCFRNRSVDCLAYVWSNTRAGCSNEELREIYGSVFHWVVRSYHIEALVLEELLSSEETDFTVP
ncbi:hypothetical protein EYC80_005533 [Monilinia laxa]|uniref:BTB domain-containing protein n=1 Tax=Monilinia laxa TaxID=61186 RepID=A0A5N6KEG4_MONLA|nr:hypothetical protein EYC80_005533 [Monilinia laxa]